MKKVSFKIIVMCLCAAVLLAGLITAVYTLTHRQEAPLRTISAETQTAEENPAAATVSQGNLTNYASRLYSIGSGLPTGEANAVLQTEDGYVWVGGYGGLLRYDGKSFAQISGSASGLNSYSIRSLYESADGTLWVGSNEQGPFCGKGGVFTQPRQDSESAYLSVRCFAEDKTGRIWFGTANGLAYIQDGSVIPFDFASCDYVNSTIYTLTMDSSGLLWAVDYSGSLVVIDPAAMNIAEIYSPGDLWNEGLYAYSAFFAGDGRLYVGTNDALILSFSPEQPETVETISSGALSRINSICQTESGEIWFCGDTGLGVYIGGSFCDLSYLPNASHLGCIAEDYEGNTWAASSKNGLLHITREKISRLIQSPMPEDSETYVVRQFDGLTYVGSEAGLFILDAALNPVSLPICDALSGIQVHHIARAQDGRIYIGTFYRGLYLYDPSDGSWEQLPVLGKRIRCLLSLSEGRIAAATDGGLELFDGDQAAETYTDFGDASQVLSVIQLADGTILCGTDGDGIYSVKDGIVSKYGGVENGLSGEIILRLAVDEQDPERIWVSCGNDLYFGSREGFQPAAELTQGAGSILDFYQQGEELWVFRSSGILRFQRSDLLRTGETAEAAAFYGTDEGLPGTIVANSWSCFDGDRFYICTTDGLACLDSRSIPVNTRIPRAAINAITFGDGSKWDGRSSIVLSPGSRRLSISMAALTFSGEGAQLEYQLVGVDPEPLLRQVQSQSEVEYTNLDSGSYTFTMRAINRDGVKGEVLSLTIQRLPRFTETLWFYLLMAALLVVLIGAAFAIADHVRIQKLKAKQQLYRDLTEQSIRTISGAIDAKDPYTNGHSQRVADFSVKLAQKMGMSEDDCERLFYIAMLHDIGKIGIPDSILKKPGRLTDEEFQVIRQHPTIGSNILKDFTALEGVAEGAKYHHERYDGNGYNEHLKGEAIPLFARIICVADAYDAMNSRRCYRDELPQDYIISELEKGSGSQFDAVIVAHAVEILKSEQPSAD